MLNVFVCVCAAALIRNVFSGVSFCVIIDTCTFIIPSTITLCSYSVAFQRDKIYFTVLDLHLSHYFLHALVNCAHDLTFFYLTWALRASVHLDVAQMLQNAFLPTSAYTCFDRGPFICSSCVKTSLVNTSVGHVVDNYFFNAWHLLAVRSLWRFYSGRGREASLSRLSTGIHPWLDRAFSFFHRVHSCAISVCFLAGAWVFVYMLGPGLQGYPERWGCWGGEEVVPLNWSGDSEADEVIPRSAPAGWENRHSGLWLSHRLVSPWQGTDVSVHICTM